MQNVLKNLWMDSRQSIVEARYCILFATILYFGAFFIGWSHPENFSLFNEVLKKLADQFLGKSAISFISKVLIHNLIATYFDMCVVVLFGFIPAVAAVFNGLMLGFVIASTPGASTSHMVSLLVPHGIFEWPAMLVAWGIGLWRGFGYRFSTPRTTYKERWIGANKAFITIILPLLFIAAIIEGRYHIAKELFP
jgi:stage II sporulation protein M